ncbi:hypothetical protein E0H93_29740 [Rhizobium leguminosarum bv. viciae]|uniref:TraC family protein n=2 Tax=Rhizobium leguminosarum TaxID=384 RepID=UPI00103F7826|nr:TraC family protein [Rhizobium leguminosarum]MBY5494503.1 hypothetical protein [Rhizobium leguminosarum]MBY5530245.1 hypothetical protein [Rhizobium leguminosarum]TBY30714.1 hypothetical protein E0H55_20765 [Rhizobium leguminosarum bv. viciae]TBY31588.1 hypothetical protein E0H60_29870 [Rhizobium leguminosarum bv. viciae]TCA99026.1 hypothetical protein E0H93_29740 [Rhizobium leguminosarum bv. viciae]
MKNLARRSRMNRRALRTFKAAETREGKRIELKGGLSNIEIDGGKLQAAFDYLAKRFRLRFQHAGLDWQIWRNQGRGYRRGRVLDHQ